MTWDARHEEALTEFRQWDHDRAKSFMVGVTAKYQPRVRAGKIVAAQRHKKSKPPRAALAGKLHVDEELRKCVSCPRLYGKSNKGCECRPCRHKRWKKQHPNAKCIGCGDYPRPETQRCRRCALKHYAAQKPACKCGRPQLCKGLCDYCYKKTLFATIPYTKARHTVKARERYRRHYYKDIDSSRARGRKNQKAYADRKKAKMTDADREAARASSRQN